MSATEAEAAPATPEESGAPSTPQKLNNEINYCYFYDTKKENGAVVAHVWRNDAEGKFVSSLHEWGDFEQLSFTGKKVVKDGETYPVYYLEFQWENEGEPTGLLFGRKKFQDGKSTFSQTEDFDFVNGGLYSYDGLDVSFNREDKTWLNIDDLPDYTDEPEYYQFYFSYPDEWGMSKWYSAWGTRVHFWGSNGDQTPWDYNYSMEEYRFLNENGYEQDYMYWDGQKYIYPYVFKGVYYGEPGQVIFHDFYYGSSTKSADLKNGALYIYDGKNVTIVENPNMESEPRYMTGSFYVIDTDKWGYDFYTQQDGKEVILTDLDTNTLWLVLNDKPDNYYVSFNIDYSFGRKWAEVNGRWYPIFKIDLTPNSNLGVLSKIQLKNGYKENPKAVRITPTYDFVEGGVYYFAGNDVAVNIKTYDEYVADGRIKYTNDIEAKPGRVIAHMGANAIMQKDLWKVPYCIMYNRPGNSDVTYHVYNMSSFLSYMAYMPNPTNDDGSENSEYADFIKDMKKYEMQPLTDASGKVIEGYYYKDFDDVNAYNDICFFYYGDEWVQRYTDEWDEELQNYKQEWIQTGDYVMNDLTASRSPYYDPSQLTGYVYDIGVDCFHQSYLTNEEFMALTEKTNAGEVEALYLVGNEPISGKPSVDPIESALVPNDNDGFYLNFQVLQEQPASFKVSTVNVAKLAEDKLFSKGLPENAYNFQRGWASFNLGMIGPHKDVNDEDYEEWYATHVYEEGRATREIRIRTDETYDYNNYCQYPWRVEVGEHGVQEEGKYWMVVDLEPENHSVTLLDFDPHPHFGFKDIEIRIEDLSAEEAAEMAPYSDVELEAAAHNHSVYFDKVYVAKGKIDVGDTDPKVFEREGYNVTYTLTLDGVKVMETTKNVSQNVIEVDNLDVSDSANITLRGRFEDTKTGKFFSTAYTCGYVDFQHNMIVAPDLLVHRAELYPTSGCTEGHETYTVRGVVVAEYSMPANLENPHYLADYEVRNIVANGDEPMEYNTPLIHKDREFPAFYGPIPYLTDGEQRAWEPWDNAQDFEHDRHNWSRMIKSSGEIPMTLENLWEGQHPYMGGAKASADFVAHAVYPFKVYRYTKNIEVGNQEAESTVAKAAAEDEDNAIDIAKATEFRLAKVVRSSAPVNKEFVNKIVTGIDTIEDDAMSTENAASVYYSLDGVKVSGNAMTPGIYIERRGTETRKILVK